MNVLVEKYDSTLKQTMVELGAVEKLARARLGVIERLRAEHKRVTTRLSGRRKSLG